MNGLKGPCNICGIYHSKATGDLCQASAYIKELERVLQLLVDGGAFGLRCNYCKEFDSTLGNLHNENCPVVIGRKLLGKT